MEAIQAVARNVKSWVGAEMRKEGMTGQMFWYLHLVVVDGQVSVGQLAESCAVTSANASLVTDDLEREGLIVRTRSKEDRRVVLVDATSRGRSLHRNIWSRVSERMVGALHGSDEREIAAAARVLTRLASASGGPTPREEGHP